jgi:uncharacterized protein CbrC (UPF0167 family)
MGEALPHFTYHPQPLTTGSVVPSDARCLCCREARGFIYVGPTYAEADIDEQLCPWCIADGSASRSFGASFVDSSPLVRAGVSTAIAEELESRTPGYVSWQQDSWLSHCEDACEFHGDASLEDVALASESTKAAWRSDYQMPEEGWADVTRNYEPKGAQAFYKFVCRHCGFVQLGWDCA